MSLRFDSVISETEMENECFAFLKLFLFVCKTTISPCIYAHGSQSFNVKFERFIGCDHGFWVHLLEIGFSSSTICIICFIPRDMYSIYQFCLVISIFQVLVQFDIYTFSKYFRFSPSQLVLSTVALRSQVKGVSWWLLPVGGCDNWIRLE